MVLTMPLHFAPFFPGVMGKKTLILEPEEAVLHVDSFCCSTNKRHPYGELQGVEKVHMGCCSGVSTSIFGGIPVCPGWGCNESYVDTIVADIKRRLHDRGDIGQMRQTEGIAAEVQAMRLEMREMRSDLKALLGVMNVSRLQQQPSHEMMNDRM